MNKQLIFDKDDWYNLLDFLEETGILTAEKRGTQLERIFGCEISVTRVEKSIPSISLEFETEQEAMMFKLKYL